MLWEYRRIFRLLFHCDKTQALIHFNLNINFKIVKRFRKHSLDYEKMSFSISGSFLVLAVLLEYSI